MKKIFGSLIASIKNTFMAIFNAVAAIMNIMINAIIGGTKAHQNMRSIIINIMQDSVTACNRT
jgi:hypothetical protein